MQLMTAAGALGVRKLWIRLEYIGFVMTFFVWDEIIELMLKYPDIVRKLWIRFEIVGCCIICLVWEEII